MINLDLSIVPALAALGGSLIGACASVAATFVGQRLQARAARLVSELREREQLYGKFVEPELCAPAACRVKVEA